MSNEPKPLTEEYIRALYTQGPDAMVFNLRERGLIAPEPVDPLLIEAREIAAHTRRHFRGHYAKCQVADKIAAGEWDDHMLVVCALAALRRGMEIEREKRPVLTREIYDAAWDAANMRYMARYMPGGTGNTEFGELLFAAIQEQLK